MASKELAVRGATFSPGAWLWPTLPVEIFHGLGAGRAAFEYLQKAEHVGEVVVTVPSRLGLRADATYLLTGGMGARGLVMAQALVEEGAKHVLLLSRSGRASADCMAQWEWLEASRAHVVSAKCDLADASSVREALGTASAKMPAVKGALHLAAVLEDATLAQLTQAHFEKSYAAKVHGAMNLHDAVDMATLDFLVLFSSVASTFGSAGQGNYAAANAALDALAARWRGFGERVWSVQWGFWREVGMAAQKGMAERR